MRRQIAMICAVVSLVVTLSPATAFARKLAAKIDARLIACWRHETPEVSIDSYAKPRPNFGSSVLMCYRRDGIVTGVAFDDGHGFDWAHGYQIQGTTIVSDRAFGQTAVDSFRFDKPGREMTTISAVGLARVWTRVCRTVREDIQCSRLHQKLNR